MNDYIMNELNNCISTFKQLPYLFVGTGLSMRYAYAPSWDQLLENTWQLLNPTLESKAITIPFYSKSFSKPHS